LAHPKTKEKLIRVLQIIEKTDSQHTMNAKQIIDILEGKYNLQNVDRRAVYRDIKLLRECGYPILKAKNNKAGWYMDKPETL